MNYHKERPFRRSLTISFMDNGYLISDATAYISIDPNSFPTIARNKKELIKAITTRWEKIESEYQEKLAAFSEQKATK